MSVLIKGVKMPKTCGECVFLVERLIYPCWCCAGDFAIKPSETDLRDGICPLVEVPTPHGRLIDADELINALPKAEADIFENCRNCTCLDTEQIQEIIGDAPTVIEAEGEE